MLFFLQPLDEGGLVCGKGPAFELLYSKFAGGESGRGGIVAGKKVAFDTEVLEGFYNFC